MHLLKCVTYSCIHQIVVHMAHIARLCWAAHVLFFSQEFEKKLGSFDQVWACCAELHSTHGGGIQMDRLQPWPTRTCQCRS